MRLIDKEVFLERMKKWEYEEYMWNALDETPEVEAIPVEFIKAYVRFKRNLHLSQKIAIGSLLEFWRTCNGQQ